jgi:small-conductance mechanosensitive channel
LHRHAGNDGLSPFADGGEATLAIHVHPPVPSEAGVRLALDVDCAALLLILERLGVSGTVLWTAFTGFAAVGAVAFFAAWSVLSNIFCTVLIFTTRPFRLQDHIEVLENGEKPGLKGRVVDINLIYTTLQEVAADAGDEGSVLQVPNSLFFQRTVRRWRGHQVPQRWLAQPARDPASQDDR